MTPQLAPCASPLVYSAAVLVAPLAVTRQSRVVAVAAWFAAARVASLVWTVDEVSETSRRCSRTNSW